jgi:hypothetical protein
VYRFGCAKGDAMLIYEYWYMLVCVPAARREALRAQHSSRSTRQQCSTAESQFTANSSFVAT